MQNIIEIVKELGIEIPADKESELTKKVAENYKTIVEHTKKVEKLEADRDNWKEQAETAQDTLKSFEGKDFEGMQKEVEAWKLKAEEAKKDYESKLAEKEKEELLKEAFTDVKFTSESAKRAIVKEISESITVKNGKLIGFSDLLDEAKKNDASAFVNEEDEKLKNDAPRFTDHKGGSKGTGGKLDIKSMSLDERMKLKSTNPELYKSLLQ